MFWAFYLDLFQHEESQEVCQVFGDLKIKIMLPLGKWRQLQRPPKMECNRALLCESIQNNNYLKPCYGISQGCLEPMKRTLDTRMLCSIESPLGTQNITQLAPGLYPEVQTWLKSMLKPQGYHQRCATLGGSHGPGSETGQNTEALCVPVLTIATRNAVTHRTGWRPHSQPP